MPREGVGNQNDAQHILIVAKAASAQRRGHAARANRSNYYPTIMKRIIFRTPVVRRPTTMTVFFSRKDAKERGRKVITGSLFFIFAALREIIRTPFVK